MVRSSSRDFPTIASPAAESVASCAAAVMMLAGSVPGSHRITVGGDKAFDTKDFVADCRKLIERDSSRRSANREPPVLEH